MLLITSGMRSYNIRNAVPDADSLIKMNRGEGGGKKEHFCVGLKINTDFKYQA